MITIRLDSNTLVIDGDGTDEPIEVNVDLEEYGLRVEVNNFATIMGVGTFKINSQSRKET